MIIRRATDLRCRQVRPTKTCITLVAAERGWGVGVIPAGTVVGMTDGLPPPNAPAPHYATAVPLEREPTGSLRLITETPTRPGDLVRCRIAFVGRRIDV